MYVWDPFGVKVMGPKKYVPVARTVLCQDEIFGGGAFD